MMKTLTLLTCLLATLPLVFAQSISQKTAQMQKKAGYFDFYWDENTGKIWLEIDKLDTEFLFVESLPAGVGSNDIGLDRGQLGETRIVKFEKIGNKILLIQPNYDYRAESTNVEEQKSVEEAFAQSVLWGFEISEKDSLQGRYLVDATPFFLQDAHGVSQRLSRTKQGSFRLDKSKSAFYLPQCKNFPKNTEIEALLTYTGNGAGNHLLSVSPNASSFTVRQHYSFVELPDNEYVTRKFDPRAGVWQLEYMDYATPLTERISKRLIVRHRLKKKDPNAAQSEAVEPIVYYIDRGAPEYIRKAMIEGGAWWNQAFEAAGYQNAFQIKLLPADADPMDLRYNVVQWVHRSTRGWSYGSTVTDPRTGEIIKGHVTLGSLRLRQDYLIAEGLLAPYEAGKEVPKAMQEIAFARLRQLVAHEIGHTLGLAHNFAASGRNRASVMDYPHPFIILNSDGTLDWSHAYDTGIGEWDKIAIQYAYQDFPSQSNEAEALEKILQQAVNQGISFISDADARPQGGAHPLAHLWDNGNNATIELQRIISLRAKVLENFSIQTIREGEPLSQLENAFVPVYLMHRYQVEAAAKMLGGLYYNYDVRQAGKTSETKIVGANRQKDAFNALLKTLSPEFLAVSEEVLQQIPPPAYGYWKGREHFESHTGRSFDPLAAAQTAAQMTLGMILNPERAARLVEYHARNTENPSLEYVLETLLQKTWQASRQTGYLAEIQKVVDSQTLDYLLRLALHPRASSQTKASCSYQLHLLKSWLETQLNQTSETSLKAHYFVGIQKIKQFEENPDDLELPEPIKAPDGSPIGTDWLCGTLKH